MSEERPRSFDPAQSKRPVPLAIAAWLSLLAFTQNASAAGETVLVTLQPGFLDAAPSGSSMRDSATRPPLAERKLAFKRCQERCLEALRGAAVRVRYRYRYSPVLALEVLTPSGREALRALAGVVRIDDDQPGQGALAESVLRVRADEVHALGIRGAGTIVAVLDSGIDTDHPDFDGALLVEYGKRFLDQGREVGNDVEDGHGHGTHVTGVIASRGVEASEGVAPECRVLPVKILDDQNRGWFSDWAAGLDYALSVHEADNGIELDAINMSLASNALYSDVCDGQHAGLRNGLEAARELGIPVFVASGNNGSVSRMALPACMTDAISVGAIYDNTATDTVTTFSNRNDLLDLLAPGATIVSSSAGGGTRIINGTSQATPHCAGAACLLREIEPSLTPEEILATLRATGVPVEDSLTNLVFPRLDVAAALSALTTPPIVGFSCAYDAPSHEVRASWDPIDGAEANGIEIAVRVNGELVQEAALTIDEQSFAFLPVEGGEVELAAEIVYSEGNSSPRRCTVETPRQWFRRGDCDANGHFEVTDAVLTLLTLFVNPDLDPPCDRACDANDDDRLDVSDATYLLSALFTGGQQPPAPYPDCASDPTPGNPPLECELSACADF